MAFGVLELDPITRLATQMATLSKQLGMMNANAIQTNVFCNHCIENKSRIDCQVGNPFAQPISKQA